MTGRAGIGTTAVNPWQARQIERAIAKLKSFHDGDLGVLDVVACGAQAVPALRVMLFERERSGLYQARCRAVAALAALGAADVLIEFLANQRIIADPVERLGEDAVINAAALALPNPREPRAFTTLLRLARHSHLTGVIGALGRTEWAEAVAPLIDALEDDASRFTAKAGLRKLERKAYQALLDTAVLKRPSADRESPSSVRRRRAALELLAEFGVRRDARPVLRRLAHDPDAKIAMPACKIFLDRGQPKDRTMAVGRVFDLLADEDWMLRDQLEELLFLHFNIAGEVDPAAYLNDAAGAGGATAMTERRRIALHRVLARATAGPGERDRGAGTGRALKRR